MIEGQAVVVLVVLFAVWLIGIAGSHVFGGFLHLVPLLSIAVLLGLIECPRQVQE